MLLRSIITSLSLQENKPAPALYLADLKGGVELSSFATMKHCAGFSTTIEGTQAMLRDIEAEMNKRLGAMRSNGNREWRGQRIIFIMDEMVDLAGVPGEAKETRAIRAQVKASLAALSAKGRAAGISLVLCTQRPDAIFAMKDGRQFLLEVDITRAMKDNKEKVAAYKKLKQALGQRSPTVLFVTNSEYRRIELKRILSEIGGIVLTRKDIY